MNITIVGFSENSHFAMNGVRKNGLTTDTSLDQNICNHNTYQIQTAAKQWLLQLIVFGVLYKIYFIRDCLTVLVQGYNSSQKMAILCVKTHFYPTFSTLLWTQTSIQLSQAVSIFPSRNIVPLFIQKTNSTEAEGKINSIYSFASFSASLI